MSQSSHSYLKSQYIGLHSSRYHNSFIIPEPTPTLYHPIGGHLVRRNALSLQEIAKFQAHNDSVVLIFPIPRLNPQKLLTISYNGDVKLFSKEGILISATRASQKSVKHGCISNSCNMIACASTFGVYDGIVDVWKISESCGFEKLITLKGNYKFCMFSPSDSLIVFRQNNADQHTSSRLRQRDLPISPHLACEDFDSDSDTEDQIEDTMESLRLRQLAKAFYYVCSFRNLQGQIDSNHITLPTYGRIGCMENNMNGLLAISYVDRTMTILHMDSLNVLHNFKLVGSGSIGCLEFINNHLYFAPSSGILVKFDVNQPKITGDVDNLISNEAFKFVRTHAQWINKACSMLRWVEQDKILLALNEYGIFQWTFKDFPHSSEIESEISVELFRITCCGLDLNPKTNSIAVGDFAGNIMVFDTVTHQLLYHKMIPSGIRCLSWDTDGDHVYVGALDGTLFKISQELEPVNLFDLQSDVICMSFKQGLSRNYLAIGVKNGDLWVFSLNSDLLILESKFLAHPKQSNSQDLNFGSLLYFSEIWTLSWSPDSGLIATGSEDQTVNIWNWTTQSLIVSLPKHSRAVTGVRWMLVNPVTINGLEISEMLLTCSDDQTMRIYNPQDWTLLHIFTTNFIREWHTITYASIEENGSRVACVTQNGYLIIFHLENLELGFHGRIHNGSVEGLDWKNGKLATCSSECCICIVDTI